MKRYNMKSIMVKAWALFRKAAKKAAITFSEALKLAWKWAKVQASNAAKVEATAAALGIEEEFHSWYGWQQLGRMVIHTSVAAFQVLLDDPTTKSGTRVQSYFVYSDTQVAPAA